MIAAAKDGETRLAELEQLPNLVEGFLRDLPDLMSYMPELHG